MTSPRRAVLAALLNEPGHMTAEEVVEAVSRVDASVHRASVYRSLEALCDLGVVQHIHLGHGGTAYHLVPVSSPHPHAQCRQCGIVLDLPMDLLDGVAARVAADLGFLLDATHVALSGICGDCAVEHSPPGD